MDPRALVSGSLGLVPPLSAGGLAACGAFLAAALPGVDPALVGDADALLASAVQVGASVGGAVGLFFTLTSWWLVRRAPTRMRWFVSGAAVACSAPTLALGAWVGANLARAVLPPAAAPPVGPVAAPALAMLLAGASLVAVGAASDQ